jgi:hypothetical protein
MAPVQEGPGAGGRMVRHYRQILLWPLQLMPLEDRFQIQRHWKRLTEGDAPWFEVADEFPDDPSQFQIRHYKEFVTFLPAVQRFLYGEVRDGKYRKSPVRVYRRSDVSKVRAIFKARPQPLELSIAHVDLYFFYDIDVVILAVEVFADDLELEVVQDLLFRFGRTYPASWDDHGRGDHCLARVEWLNAAGVVVAASDYEDRQKFLACVCRERAAEITADWEFMLAPMVDHASEKTGVLRYRQLEYARMPVMAYLAVEDPAALSRADFVRLALAARPGESARLPYSARDLADFEANCCYDRYWGAEDTLVPRTRFMASGQAFIMVGEAGRAFYVDAEQGMLAQFRHQYFLLFLIAHFHKASLLMFGDRLGSAVSRLDIRDAESVKRFKRTIRQVFEIFLRFTHRYWFQEISTQTEAKTLFAMFRRHHATDPLYDGIRREVQDMAQYIDSDGLRRQANTVVRLTVVTTFGLIATVTTGFLGMNVIAAAEEPLWVRMLYFVFTSLPTAGITLYTIMISKRLSDLMEALSDERLSFRKKLSLIGQTWTGSGGNG